jgi:hypothetical protein
MLTGLKYSGDVLLSHDLSVIVSSAQDPQGDVGVDLASKNQSHRHASRSVFSIAQVIIDMQTPSCPAISVGRKARFIHAYPCLIKRCITPVVLPHKFVAQCVQQRLLYFTSTINQFKVKKNAAPSFVLLSAHTLPPCRRITRSTIARPIPVPSNSFSEWSRLKGRNIFSA